MEGWDSLLITYVQSNGVSLLDWQQKYVSVFNTYVWITMLDLVLGSGTQRCISPVDKLLPLIYRRETSTYINVCWLEYSAGSHSFLWVFYGHLKKKKKRICWKIQSCISKPILSVPHTTLFLFLSFFSLSLPLSLVNKMHQHFWHQHLTFFGLSPVFWVYFKLSGSDLFYSQIQSFAVLCLNWFVTLLNCQG